MGFFGDLFFLIVRCVEKLQTDARAVLLGTLAAGVSLGVLCWIACSYYAYFWNLRFRITLTHHMFCGIATLLTMLFTLTFVSLKYTEQVAKAIVLGWQQIEILNDSSWKHATFRKAYEEVKALGIEDFTQYPHPDQGGNLIPVSRKESQETSARVYANEAVQHFKKSHSYLSMILKTDSDVPTEVIYKDNAQFFVDHPGQTYPLENAVKLAADHIRQGLEPQAVRVVRVSRGVLAVLFLLVQGIPFGLIGFAAYRDLKAYT